MAYASETHADHQIAQHLAAGIRCKRISSMYYYAALSGPSGELKSDLGNDGVHPNRKGYAVMRQLIDVKLSAAKR